MDKMIENQPPVKKLKQATLSFAKSVPAVKELKVHPVIQSKKRRNSNSLESTSSCSKINKALTPLESPNSKASKKRKLSQISNEDKTNEVSSSSEAESAPGKNSNGRCCLLDRFVKVLPPDVHQEISSTNEVLDISGEIDGSQTEKTQTDEVSDKVENCIVIEDDSSSCNIFPKASENVTDVQNVTPSSANSELNLPTSDVLNNCDPENETLSQKALAPEPSSVTLLTNENNHSLLADVSVSSEESLSHEADASVVSADNLNESGGNISFSAEMTSSTPMKSPQQKILSKIKKTPKTSASESSSKKRKYSSSMSLEKESEKKKRKEEREKEKMEKKKKLEEQKAEKERLKQERKSLKEAKEREKQEIKEKLEKEKIEKERAKEEERKKKEEEKLKKEDDKKKKLAVIEAKQEEKRKKEEEKVKEEEEKKKKEQKAKQVFQKFFIKPKETPVKQAPTSGMFIPFQVKKDMHLAPIVRRDALSEDKRNTLDQFINHSQSCVKTYLVQLKSGDTKPHKTGRVLRKNPEPVADVEVIHDSEILKKVTHEVKLLQFHTDYRPPYYGTWRKQPKISARNPWKKDLSVFDYEVDSDEEWEEEEPGESLSCSEGEEEKGEEVEEDEDDGWMVPHGYLSEGEGCNEDEEITPEKLKRQQLAKAKAWEEEMNRKLQVAPLITVGCFFQHCPSSTMSGDVRLLYEFRAVVLTTCTPIPTCMYSSPEQDKEEATPEKATAATPKGPRKKSVPDEAMPDLIKLVHGNVSGIKRLIREFTAYWCKKFNISSSSPESPKDNMKDSSADKDVDAADANESVNEPVDKEDKKEKTDSEKTKDEDVAISKRQLDLTITSIAVREKRDGFHKICWYVHDPILKQYSMTDIQLPNTWVYLTAPPKFRTPNVKIQGTPNLKSEDTPNLKLQETPNRKSQGTPNRKSQGTPNRKSQGTPNLKSQGTPNLKSKGTPNRKSQEMHSLKSQETPNSHTNAPVMNETEDAGVKEVLVKHPPKDQRSIKDFALSKEEIAKKKENQPVKPSEIVIDVDGNEVNNMPTGKNTLTNQPQSLQPTPKDGKKSGNQRSIIEFAKKANSSPKSLQVSVNDKLKMICTVNLSKLEAETTPEQRTSSEETAAHFPNEECIEIKKSPSAPEQLPSNSVPADPNCAEEESQMDTSSTVDKKQSIEEIDCIMIE